MNWFVIALPEPERATPETDLAWARVGGTGVLLEQGLAPLTALTAFRHRGDQILVLVPGERVLLHHVTIPARSRAAQRQALPFALEERLSEDLEAMHIVPGPRLPDTRLLAAVVAHRDMVIWQRWLQEAGITAQVLVPDTALLPTGPAEHLRVYCAGERCLIDAPGEEPLALAHELLPWWLSRWVAGRDADLVLEWHGPEATLPEPLPAGIALNRHDWDGDRLALLAPALCRRPSFNLLSGPYAAAGSGGQAWARWRLPAALAASVVLVWAASLGLDIRHLEQEVRVVDRGISDLFEATLPNTRMVDPVGQFRQVLGTGVDGTDGAPPHAGAIAVRLGQTASVLNASGGTLRQFRAEGDRLELELDLDSIAALDRLRGQLAERAGVAVRILSAESGEDGVRARLQIEGGRS